MPQLRVIRQGDRAAFLRPLKLLLDGEVCARLRTEDEVVLAVPAAGHVMQVALDWARSAELNLDLKEGETIDLEARVPWRYYWQCWVKPKNALELRLRR